MNTLKFEVRATIASEPLAAFQFKEWAEEWRYKMCRTGIITEHFEQIVGGDLTHEMVPMQEDGGGIRLVDRTEDPNFPRDGGR